ncbi:MAG: glycerol-3-phosphate dehydrogenase/oxidase [Halioglobus sp.]
MSPDSAPSVTEVSRAGFTHRQQVWDSLLAGEGIYDLVVVGGGIIGAGVLREAARRGLRVLLVEQQDFAWGTSSRSSKMVHGGLRYISQGDIALTKHSLQERERLLREAPGLIDRMGYYFTLRKGQFPGRLPFTLLLKLYDRLAGIKNHRYHSNKSLACTYPGLDERGLKGAMYYTDTVTDDARLVLRVLQEAQTAGGEALNYVKADSLVFSEGQLAGLRLRNVETDETVQLDCPTVISATGAWADQLRNEINPEKRIRPLRGSHLVFAAERLPAPEALTLFHPKDKRPVFVFPWEGTTVVGTTDLDHTAPLDEEPAISAQELDYLLEALEALFPQHKLGRDDVVSTWSGVRPVIGSEESKDPSKERRDHAVWNDHGLITVSGGKLTTFRLIALDALRAANGTLPSIEEDPDNTAVFAPLTVSAADLPSNDEYWGRRLLGRYGDAAKRMLEEASESERLQIPGTLFCLAECRWALRNEAVAHLDDLLLRRTRLGSILPNGASELFKSLQVMCAEELGWEEERWAQERTRYESIWQRCYGLP